MPAVQKGETSMEVRETAERFVEDRLSDYERMWDGCGCKIEYHS